MLCLLAFVFLASATQAETDRASPASEQRRAIQARLAAAPAIHLSPSVHGLGPPEGNSPAVWSKDQATHLHVFTNDGRKTLRLSAPATNPLTGAWETRPVELPRSVAGHEPALYVEAVERDEKGLLYGWYHLEIEICGVTRKSPPCDRRGLMAPAIGMAVSSDDGAHWSDRGLILTCGASPCSIWNGNGNFNGGNGDFSVALDPSRRFAYLFFTNYCGTPKEHGIALARMPWSLRADAEPARHVRKWYDGAWREAGLGGRASAILPASVPWDEPDYDSFWGPAVHYNTYLEAFVMLLNHTSGAQGDPCWPSQDEKIYIAYCPDPTRPEVWTDPVPLVSTTHGCTRYPQVLGIRAGETDRLAGKSARLFLHGLSTWMITFSRSAAHGSKGHP